MLPVDAGSVPAFARVERGPRGLRFAPAGDAAAPGPPDSAPAARLRGRRPGRRAPRPPWWPGASWRSRLPPGVAFSLALPRMRVVHDRRPPGLDRTRGAPPGERGPAARPTTAGARSCCRAWATSPPTSAPARRRSARDGRAVAACGRGDRRGRLGGEDEAARRHGGRRRALLTPPTGRAGVAAGAARRAPGDGARAADRHRRARRGARGARARRPATRTAPSASGSRAAPRRAPPGRRRSRRDGAAPRQADGALVGARHARRRRARRLPRRARRRRLARRVEGARVIAPSTDPRRTCSWPATGAAPG